MRGSREQGGWSLEKEVMVGGYGCEVAALPRKARRSK